MELIISLYITAGQCGVPSVTAKQVSLASVKMKRPSVGLGHLDLITT